MSRADAWRERGIGRFVPYICLLLIMAMAAIMQIVWLSIDTRPQPGIDPNEYLRKTYIYLNLLEESGWQNAYSSLPVLGYTGRPPLYQLAAIPFVLIIGRTEDAPLYVNVLFQILLIWSLFQIGRSVHSDAAGLLAAWVSLGYAPLTMMSTIFRPVYGVAAWVAFSFWLLLVLLNIRTVRAAWIFSIAFCLGLFIHPEYIYAMVLPTLITGIYMVLFQTPPSLPSSISTVPSWLWSKLREPFVWLGFLPAILLGGLVVGSWYLTQSSELFKIAQDMGETGLGGTRGFGNIERSFLWYLQTGQNAVSNVLLALAIAGIAICLVAGVRKHRLSLFILPTYLILEFIVFSARPGQYAWFRIGTILPIAAAVTAVGILKIPDLLEGFEQRWVRIGRAISGALVMICVIVAGFNYIFVTWGGGKTARFVASALGSQVESELCNWRMHAGFCPNPPADDNWVVEEAIDLIMSEDDCKTSICKLAVQGNNATPYQYYHARAYPSTDLQLRSFLVRFRDDSSTINSIDNLWWLDYDLVLYAPTTKSKVFMAWFLESPFAPIVGYSTVADFKPLNGQPYYLAKRTEPIGNQRPLIDELLAQWNKDDAADLRSVAFPFESQPIPADSIDPDILAVEQFIDEHPRLASLYVLPVQAYLAAGMTDRAIATADKARAVADSAEVLSALGQLYLDVDQPDIATTMFEQAYAIGTDDVGKYLALAEELYALEKIPAAIDAAKAALELEPGSYTIMLALAKMYEAAGNLDAAVATAERAVDQPPERPPAYMLLERLYRQQGRDEDALIALRSAAESAPDRSDLCFKLGERLESFDQAQATTQYQKCLATAPDSDNSAIDQTRDRLDELLKLSLLSDAQEYYAEGQVDAATEAYEAALEYESQSDTIMLALAEMYEAANDLDAAVATAETVVSQAPGFPKPYMLLERLYRKQGRDEDALNALRSAAASDPNRPDLCYKYGNRLESFDQAQAITQYQKCVTNDEDDQNPFVQQSQERLDVLQSEQK